MSPAACLFYASSDISSHIPTSSFWAGLAAFAAHLTVIRFWISSFFLSIILVLKTHEGFPIAFNINYHFTPELVILVHSLRRGVNIRCNP